MTDAKSMLRRLIPASAWQRGSAAYWWWYNRGRHQAAAMGSRRRRRSVRALRRLRDSHAGERCFIIGNGPSLRSTDLRLLRREVTFGMNRIYLAFPDLGYETSYYLAVNTLVIEQCAGEIVSLSMPKFVTWRGRHAFRNDPSLIFLDTDYEPPPTFSRDVSRRVFEGSTVTFVALQLAFHMGFREVILVGVDHNFSASGPPNQVVVSQGPDQDHFSQAYFGKGFAWQLPDLEASERAYRMAREAYRAAGRSVLDATVGGKLDVFPKVDFRSLFS